MDAAAPSLLEPDCVHVWSKDNRFAARMRVHQSWYRQQVLGLPPGPHASARGALYGNILRESDGLDGANFLTTEIHAAAEARLIEGDGLIDALRLRRNMLGSQPLCFNLFAPLMNDLPLATRLLQCITGFPADAHVTSVLIEFAPHRQSHLEDGSSFDAFVEYERPSGALGFLGIETKFIESFSNKRYELKRGYSRWMECADWWWQPGSEKNFPEPAYNQLWRNQLLVFAMLHQILPKYREGYCVVLYPSGDTDCSDGLSAYRRYLNPKGRATLLEWGLEGVIAKWQERVGEPSDCEWLDSLHLRYVDFVRSQAAWESVRPRRFAS